MRLYRAIASALVCLFLAASSASSQTEGPVAERNDSVMIQLVDADLRGALQALAPYLSSPMVFGALGDYRITVETPSPIPRTMLPTLLRGMLQVYGLGLEERDGILRVGTDLQQATDIDPSAVALYVIRLKHGRAADVANVVNALYGQAFSLGEVGRPAGTLADGLRADLLPPVETPEEASPVPVSPLVAEFAGAVTIIPDERTNSLLVRAEQRDFELIQAAVQQLDVRPLQVLIEVVIAEVRRDRSLALGMGTTVPPQRIPGSDTDIGGSVTGLGLGDFVVSVMNAGGIDLSATLAVASSRGEVSILSRPVILAANNVPAEIMVGSQRPFIQVQRALPTDGAARDQVVQFRDVGTRLTVVPTVSEDGYVMLEVVQEVNAATAEVAFDAPVISTRSVQTQLLVKDGHTAVLGGLTDRQHDFVRSGVPLLSSIPLLGGLFGRQVARSSETELFVFLTPRVIRNDEELSDLTEESGDRTRALRGGGGLR